MHDDYKPLAVPVGLELCPCCGGKAELWQYSTAPDAPATKVVMCATNEPIGPQDGLTNEGCPLYMPPDCHYRATIREAVKFWNEFSKALTALQRKNRWRSTPLSGEVSMADLLALKPEPDHYMRDESGRPLPVFHLSTLLQFGERVALAAVEAERQWISVEDRLPEPNVEVLCAGQGWADPFVTCCYYDEEQEGWWTIRTHWTDAVDSRQYPTHWMALPPPPAIRASSKAAA